MRCLALIAAALALAACQTTKPPVVPQIVRVPVETMVPVPAKLTKQVPVYQIQSQTYGEAIRAANLRKLSAEQCNWQLGEIEALGQKP